ncbi:MAG: tyrosine--tRNA ligase [Patescibacteria group bacterium]
MNPKEAQKILDRRVLGFFPNKEEVLGRLASEKQLSFYLGIDPTGPSLHLGHTVPALLLKSIGALGHRIIILIGDFTARIGDPDKSSARQQLSAEEVAEHMKNYEGQLKKIFGDVSYEVRHNQDWLGLLNLTDVIDLTSKATVQQMMIRDMFQERVKNDKPVYVHELLYPLLQGYDSVAMDVDGEVGGNDQTFNMLVGRDLLREYRGKDKIVLATRLLVDAASGKKVSKTEGGMISLDDSPGVIFQKISNTVPNEMIKTVFELCTEVEIQEIESRERRAQEEGDYKSWNKELAYKIVNMYHGESAAHQALENYESLASGKIPEEIKEIRGSFGNDATLADVLFETGLISSKSEAKRLIEQGAVKVNNIQIKNVFDPANLSGGDIIKVGTGTVVKYMN